jgi:hypothetical protein
MPRMAAAAVRRIEILLRRRLSQAEIERAQLKIDEVRLYLPH